MNENDKINSLLGGKSPVTSQNLLSSSNNKPYGTMTYYTSYGNKKNSDKNFKMAVILAVVLAVALLAWIVFFVIRPFDNRLKTISCVGSGSNYKYEETIIYNKSKKRTIDITYNYSYNLDDTNYSDNEYLIVRRLESLYDDFDSINKEDGVTYQSSIDNNWVNVEFNARRSSISSDELISEIFRSYDKLDIKNYTEQFKEVGMKCTVK